MRTNPLLIGAALAFVFGPTAHAGTIDFDYTGMVVDYTVPTSGDYALVAFGAQGGAGTVLGIGGDGGGLGAEIGGQFLLDAGNVLEIAVGGEGGAPPFGAVGGGGGGGSFVFDKTTDALLIAAGGGGGNDSGGAGQTTTGGTTGGGDLLFPGGAGSANGQGGGGAYGAGGGGFLSSGGGSAYGAGGGGSWPGLAGGSALAADLTGGFGGGGGGGEDGGGYSGGGGGGDLDEGGGGGGSYLSSLASNPILTGGVQSDYGSVTLKLVAVIPEPATWAMMLTGFAGLGFVGYGRKRRGRAPIGAA